MKPPPAWTISPLPSGPVAVNSRYCSFSISSFLAWAACLSKSIPYFLNKYFAADFGMSSEITFPKDFLGLMSISSKTLSELIIGIFTSYGNDFLHLLKIF